MTSPYLAEVRAFAFAYAPKGWAVCAGQLMSIAQSSALFSLLGVNYGGNGTTTFALPNLQGGLALGAGAGPGRSPYDVGETGGAPSVQLNQSELAAHTHGFNVANATGTTTVSQANMLGYISSGGTKLQPTAGQMYSTSSQPTAQMSPLAIGPSGVGGNHDNMMPYLAMTYCIAIEGMFPPRPDATAEGEPA